jgi:outer membrane protein
MISLNPRAKADLMSTAHPLAFITPFTDNQPLSTNGFQGDAMSVINRTSFKTLLLIALCSCALATNVTAETSVKIATVDVSRILNESPDALSKRKALDERAAQLKKSIESKKAALMELEAKAKSAKADENSPEVEKLRNDARAFERFVKDSDEELRKEFLKVNKSLSEKVLKAVSQYAQEKKIDLVLDGSAQGRTAVLYGATSIDITSAILATIK